MGIKDHKIARVRDNYQADLYDQSAGNPDSDAPTHCIFCGDALTSLRRESGRGWCTKDDCLLGGRRETTKNWALIDLPKQGVTIVIRDGSPIISHKRGPV